MEFMMMRNRVVASPLGHVIEFKKGELTHVPPALYSEVLAAGGVPKDELPEDEEVIKTTEPADPVARTEAIQAAIKKIVERANRDDFTATGAPSPKVLSAELGWVVGTAERNQQWAAFQSENDD